jgi:hypothetical protein
MQMAKKMMDQVDTDGSRTVRYFKLILCSWTLAFAFTLDFLILAGGTG